MKDDAEATKHPDKARQNPPNPAESGRTDGEVAPWRAAREASHFVRRLREADSLLRAIDYERGAEARPPLSEDNLEQLNDYLANYPEPL